jgi:hypothetical protein
MVHDAAVRKEPCSPVEAETYKLPSVPIATPRVVPKGIVVAARAMAIVEMVPSAPPGEPDR